jgi:D-cysteine desulfhydrase
MVIARLRLTHTPTPVVRCSALDALVGAEVWVKRDDMTGGAEAGNKLRKLEFLLADAQSRQADTVITCGAAQSNHVRTTALTARQRGMHTVALLRVKSEEDKADKGNLALVRRCGAEIEFISPEQYHERGPLMAARARQLESEGKNAYVIPEGGSNGLGALGYVEAARELAEQQRLGLCPAELDSIVCACGSGGTAAGLALGIARYGVASQVDAMAVCDDRGYFETVTQRIAREAREFDRTLPTTLPLFIHDAYKGPAYGVMSEEQSVFLAEVSQRTGLVFDPVYTGKALFGLSRLEPKPRRVLFLHTGGLPGALAAM